jgi:ferric-dicitrate binding protein FerR (iron transport regulator)
MIFSKLRHKYLLKSKIAYRQQLQGKIADDAFMSEHHPEQLDELIMNLTAPAITFTSVNTDLAWEKVQHRISAHESTRGRFIKPSVYVPRLAPVLVRIAAVFILALTAYFMFRYEASPAYITQTADNSVGMQALVLPDGSKVYLKEGASITYPDAFTADERKVEFEGEAFFEITADPSKPFRIMAGPVGVEVLGTSFNLDACPGHDQVVLSLHSGQVLFYSLDPDNGEIKEKVLLKPGQSGIYSCQTGLLHRSLAMEPNHLAWKTGVLEFNDTPLNEVLDQLSEHYQLEFQCEHPSPEQLKLTATFDNEPIESVIESIGLIFGFEECETDSVVRLK